ncbi:hypothetical protein B0T19DRAFT_442576 [Cercophora scortea]|uniref:TauD/TfdA-like domain-containing protein n=1 Tax=Cercophora scortea TaxID=314031 RepID=A0AAE0IPB3_9PEZI|nr:hypothetical protein B0T19DRAFT_442576 [Cercophora scortea]
MAALSLDPQPLGLDRYSLELPSDDADLSLGKAQAGGFSLGEALPGFPDRYSGARVWTGSEMALKQHEWVSILSDQDRAHIQAALRHFQSLHLGPDSISPETFPLPQDLSRRLRELSGDCYNGRGFGILRGLRAITGAYTDEEQILVFAGVSSHVARERGFQDVNREVVICHVVSEDMRPGAKEQDLRPAFTNGRLSFHTDLGDILALYAMDVSDTGGETMIVSSSQIYNELAQIRPDLLQELAKNWAFFHSQDYETDGSPLITNVPGDNDNDKLVFQYSRLPVTGFRNTGANSSLPTPTPTRLEAMALVEVLAWKHALALPRESGDIAFINNLCLMHGRTPFDLDAAGNPLPSRRHLAKLMLRDPERTWDLPETLGWYAERVYGPNREDGRREETWLMKVGADKEGRPDGNIWAGAGGHSNG